jgi:hypothetical protein
VDDGMLMLIDTRPPPDDGGGGSKGEPWLVTALGWLLPWPALIVWLCVASRLIDGWIGVFAIFLAIGLATWRGLRHLPMEGLTEQKQ